MLLAVVAALATVLTAASVGVAANGPTLRLIGHQPLVVKGDAFHPGERIVLTALTPTGSRRLVVRATSTGRFGATFRLASQPCGRAFAVRAVGRLGSHAILTIPGRACVPPPID